MTKYFKKIFRYFLAPYILVDFVKLYMKSDGRLSLKFKDIYPIIWNKTKVTRIPSHYVYHTAWAARKVRELNPQFHLDISSSLYFCSILSAFIHTKFYDFRPAKLILSNLDVGHLDLTKLDLPTESVMSLSCMHTVEHVGLGRYGDELDWNGDLKAINELKRVTAKGGSLIFVVPVGRPRIEYNAHRVYSYDQIIYLFREFDIKEFALETDNGNFDINADPKTVPYQNFACGCFHFIKR